MTKINAIEGILPANLVKSAHIYRQICATCAACLLSVTLGLTFGFTSVLLPQLEEDENYPYEKSLDSWIASISPLAMLIGCLFSGSLSDAIGRRMGQIVLSIPFIIGWIIMGVSTNNTMMMVGRFITGVCCGGLRPNTVVYVGELTHPTYRAVALFCLSAAAHLGVLMSHTIGKYVYWKISCYLFAIPTVITLIMLMFLKESPLWLLTKDKMEEGIESFRSFRGNGESSEKELAQILKMCKERKDNSSIKELMCIILSKPFMKSLVTMVLLFAVVQWCGINTLSFYAEDIFQRTFSGDIDAFMLMLATDCVRLLSAVVMCIIIKMIPRKPTFLVGCFSTSLLLVALVIYLYLNPAGLEWLAILFLIAYITIASEVSSVAWSFVAELFPTKVRGFASGLASGLSFGLLFVSVKVTPEIMSNFGEPVLYAVFAIITLICGVFLVFLLPETNGKSLQDIEDMLYKKKNVDKTDTIADQKV